MRCSYQEDFFLSISGFLEDSFVCRAKIVTRQMNIESLSLTPALRRLLSHSALLTCSPPPRMITSGLTIQNHSNRVFDSTYPARTWQLAVGGQEAMSPKRL